MEQIKNEVLQGAEQKRTSHDSAWRLYRRTWLRTETPLPVPLAPTCWLLFMDSMGLGEQMVTQLAGAGHRVIQLRPGKRFVRASRDKYQIRPEACSDYASLMADITRRGSPPQKIAHLWSVVNGSPPPSIESALVSSFYSLLYLAQALDYQQIRAVDLAVISNCLYSVAGEVTSQPERATLLGPVRVIPKAYPGVVCRSIDCDPTVLGMSFAAVQLIAEHCAPFYEPVVVYRGSERWSEGVERVEAKTNTQSIHLRTRGVYLITGGLGRPALAIAQELSRKCQAHIVLVDRKPCPPAAQWQEKLADVNTPDGVKETLTGLLGIGALGGWVSVLSADVTQKEELQAALATIRTEFREIHGVIHAAGFRDDAKIEDKTAESVARVFAPKIEGTRILQELLRDAKLDFFVLSSSLDCLLPQTKTVDYTAACAFLDCLATSRRDMPLVSINWPEVEQEEKTESNLSGKPTGNGWGRRTAEIFVKIPWRYAACVVAVSSDDLEKKPIAGMPRHVGSGKSSAERANVEAVVVYWLKELMTLEECGLDDDFFDLGGDSLIGAQLFSRINSTYKVHLGLSQLLEARTVRQLGQLVRQEQGQEQPRRWSPMVAIQPNGKRPALFVISGIGGNVVKFHGLAFHLGSEQPMYGLLPRGLDGNEAFHTRIEEMAADFVKAIRQMQPQGAYRLAGYSFGGVVAFEVARQIEQAGGKIAFLGLFDAMEWHYLRKVDSSLRLLERVEAFREQLRSIMWNENRWSHLLRILAPRYSYFRYLIYKAVGRPLPQKAGSIEEINTFAIAHYQPKPLSGKLTLFRAGKRAVQEGNDDLLGWGSYALGGTEVHRVPCTHFNIFQEPAVKVLAQQLRSCLDRADS